MHVITQIKRDTAVRSAVFWDYFETEAAPKLGLREDTFRQTFAYLDRFARPVGIVETGCVRKKDNWQGDGQSTLLFDRYAKEHSGSVVYAVDIDSTATELCRQLVGDSTKVHTGDSVQFLAALVAAPPADLLTIDLLYLDSVDVDMYAPWPSAIHHLKELLAIAPLLSPETLVVVDDSPTIMLGQISGSNFTTLGQPRIGGKGQLIAEYADALGVKSHFMGYQCGWVGLGRRAMEDRRAAQ